MVYRKVYRITTFVPPDRVDALLDGIIREVPLAYGRYDCSAWWSAVGVEQFRPLPGAQPTFGEVSEVQSGLGVDHSLFTGRAHVHPHTVQIHGVSRRG
jgi:hypothetical protein